MRKIAALLICGLVSFQLHAEPELRGSPYELEKFLSGVPKMVSITGESEIKLPADRAVVMLEISTESKYLQDALKSNQVVRAKLLGYLKSQEHPDRARADVEIFVHAETRVVQRQSEELPRGEFCESHGAG